MFTTLADDQIVLHYQPLADRFGVVVGFEALMRWHHQERGPVSPEAFIPVFESNGLIVPLSRWALAQACTDAAAWPTPLTVSVNLSAVQFEDGALPRLVHNELERSGLAPERLEVEIKEATLLANVGQVRDVIERLAGLGIAIALDDFGTSAGSPGLLKDFRFTKIKIDPTLIAGIHRSATANSVVRMIVELGHSRGLVVAAKGVETEAQLDFLRAEGCDMLQGFLVGSPTPVADLAGVIDHPVMPAERRLVPAGDFYIPEQDGPEVLSHAHPRS